HRVDPAAVQRLGGVRLVQQDRVGVQPGQLGQPARRVLGAGVLGAEGDPGPVQVGELLDVRLGGDDEVQVAIVEPAQRLRPGGVGGGGVQAGGGDVGLASGEQPQVVAGGARLQHLDL